MNHFDIRASYLNLPASRPSANERSLHEQRLQSRRNDIRVLLNSFHLWRSQHQAFASGQTCFTDTLQNCDTVTGHGCCCAFQNSFWRSTVPRVMVSNWSKRTTDVHPYPPATLFPWSAPLESPSCIPCSNWLWFDQCLARNWKDDCLEDSAQR